MRFIESFEIQTRESGGKIEAANFQFAFLEQKNRTALSILGSKWESQIFTLQSRCSRYTDLPFSVRIFSKIPHRFEISKPCKELVRIFLLLLRFKNLRDQEH